MRKIASISRRGYPVYLGRLLHEVPPVPLQLVIALGVGRGHHDDRHDLAVPDLQLREIPLPAIRIHDVQRPVRHDRLRADVSHWLRIAASSVSPSR